MSWWNDVDAALADVPHAVVGAIAPNAYMAPRNTADLDIAVRHRDYQTARLALERAGFDQLRELAFTSEPNLTGSAWQTHDQHDFDLLSLSHRWATHAIEEAQENRSEHAGGLPVIPLHYLALMKLAAARYQDNIDLGRLLGAASVEQWERIKRAVSDSRPQDLEDLEAIRTVGLWERDASASGEQQSPGDDERSGPSW